MVAKKKSSSKKPLPVATGKAKSAAGVRKMGRENIQYYEAMLDSVGDILDYPEESKLYKKADKIIETYHINDPKQKVSQNMANALSREFNILMKAVEADKKASKAPKPPAKKKK